MPQASPLISPLPHSETRLATRLEVVGALFRLAAADLHRSLVGVDRFCRFVGGIRVSQRIPEPEAADRADRIVAAFEAAAGRYPRRDLALALPAAMVGRLRRAGIPAELVVGLRLFPLRAQTWVEIEGKRIGKAPSARDLVRVLARY